MTKVSDALERQSARITRANAVWASLIVVIFIVLLGRVVQLKVDPPEQLFHAAGRPYATFPDYARRGDILDREGRVIATSAIGYRLFVDPKVVEDIYTVSIEISALIGGDPVAYDRKIFERVDSRYVVLDHLLDDWQVAAIREARLPGVGLAPRLVREYTNGEIGEAIVGKVGFEHTGLAGAEYRYDERMAPTNGRLTYLTDASGNPLWIEPEGYVGHEDGGSVRLSIDLVIQNLAERRVREAVEEYNAGGGRMVVLDVRTGELLALVDILREREGWDEFTTDPYRRIHPALGRNRCATDPYEPGSTFKPFIWSVATETGKARINEVLPTPGGPPGWRHGRRIIRDSHYYGPSTWEKVLVKSMNTGMAMIATRFSHGEMRDAILRWGFGRETGAGLPGESPGMVTPAERWNDYSQLSVAYGHEMLVTPLQMAQAFSAFARDGSMPQMRTAAIADTSIHVPVVRQVIQKETAELMRKTLRKVMLHGTGRRALSEKYRIWGKSGTAQLPNLKEGGYYEHRYVSSFIAGAPLESPRIVVLCVIDDPDRSIQHWGGIVAGQPVRDVIDDTLGYLGVPPDAIDLDEEKKLLPLRDVTGNVDTSE